jgi:hypothetical protein
MGAALAPLTDAIAALGTVGVCAAYTLLILPDSLSEEAKAAVSQPVGGRDASCWLQLLLAACLCWLAANIAAAGACQPTTLRSIIDLHICWLGRL